MLEIGCVLQEMECAPYCHTQGTTKPFHPADSDQNMNHGKNPIARSSWHRNWDGADLRAVEVYVVEGGEITRGQRGVPPDEMSGE